MSVLGMLCVRGSWPLWGEMYGMGGVHVSVRHCILFGHGLGVTGGTADSPSWPVTSSVAGSKSPAQV